MKLLIMFIMPRKSYDHVVRERNIDENVSSIFSQRSETSQLIALQTSKLVFIREKHLWRTGYQ